MYKYKQCGKRYEPNLKERSYSKEVRRQTIKLNMERNSGRVLARILHVYTHNKAHERDRTEKRIK